MTIGTDAVRQAEDTSAVGQIGALPDAPLAMPKQRLDRVAPLGGGVRGAVLRSLFARPGRSEG